MRMPVIFGMGCWRSKYGAAVERPRSAIPISEGTRAEGKRHISGVREKQ
jgi:hypothetical protein